jgi:hypothetical protein
MKENVTINERRNQSANENNRRENVQYNINTEAVIVKAEERKQSEETISQRLFEANLIWPYRLRLRICGVSAQYESY